VKRWLLAVIAAATLVAAGSSGVDRLRYHDRGDPPAEKVKP